MKVLLYCDGSFRPPAQGGVGVVLADPDTGTPLKRFGEPLQHPVRSSNEAEYWALLRGLEECLKLGADSVEIYTDSTLVHGQLTQGWACNHEHLRRLRDEARALLTRFEHWTLERIESEANPLAHTYANISATQNRWQHPRRAVDIHGKTQTEGGNDTMKLVVTAQAQTLPDDVYLVELLDVQQQDGAYGEQFVWQLRVADGEFAGTELRAWSNASTAVNAKAVKWAAAFAGKPYAQGDVIDFDALQGKVARAVVQTKQTADGREFARVTDILPLKRVQASPSRVKHGMVAVPATSQGEDPDDPFAQP